MSHRVIGTIRKVFDAASTTWGVEISGVEREKRAREVLKLLHEATFEVTWLIKQLETANSTPTLRHGKLIVTREKKNKHE